MTYSEYRDAVIAVVARRTGWTLEQATNATGEVDDAEADGLSVEDAASEILLAMAEASE